MKKIKVVNIKCEGCKGGIIASLEARGLKNVDIDIENQTVSFNGDEKVAREMLDKMGYPEKGSSGASCWIRKMRSYISCAKGKMMK